MPAACTAEQVAGRSDRPQRQARHLHQLRQPARSVRHCRAGLAGRRRNAVRGDAAGAGGPGRAGRQPRRGTARPHRPAARRARHCAAGSSLRPASGLRAGEVAIAVVGAHLSGMPLSHELSALGARFLQATATAADYQLFALDGGSVPRPGLLRVPSGTGAAIALEDVGAVDGRLRPLRRRRAAAAVDRLGPAGRRLAGRKASWSRRRPSTVRATSRASAAGAPSSPRRARLAVNRGDSPRRPRARSRCGRASRQRQPPARL